MVYSPIGIVICVFFLSLWLCLSESLIQIIYTNGTPLLESCSWRLFAACMRYLSVWTRFFLFVWSFRLSAFSFIPCPLNAPFSLKSFGLMRHCCLNRFGLEYLPAFVFRQWDNVLFHFSLFAYVPHIIWLSMQTFQEHLNSSSKKKSLRAKTRVVPQIWQYVLPISVTQHGSPNAKSFFAIRWMSIGERVGWMEDTTILSLHAFALIQRDFFLFFFVRT